MKSISQWLGEYQESHQNRINKNIHWVCVPAIMFSVIGLLWSIPVPEYFEGYAFANWASIILMLWLMYYALLSRSLALGMVLVLGGMLFGNYLLDRYVHTPLWMISGLIFAVAWIGQFVGHVIEGQRPSFFKDLQFLLIGPAWLLSFVFRRLGIRYQ
ncbi:DUF962 domain-containing protein [Acidobacteria bacterium AH-259-A15]|nr:DUF962 domain-containing protein [Acidobacteria bacterium AH-259-A15]